MTYDVARSQRSKPYGFVRGPVCAPPEWPCDALEGREEAAPQTGERIAHQPSAALSVPSVPVNCHGLAEVEGKPSRPKQA